MNSVDNFSPSLSPDFFSFIFACFTLTIKLVLKCCECEWQVVPWFKAKEISNYFNFKTHCVDMLDWWPQNSNQLLRFKSVSFIITENSCSCMSTNWCFSSEGLTTSKVRSGLWSIWPTVDHGSNRLQICEFILSSTSSRRLKETLIYEMPSYLRKRIFC